jgi:hypothetical protein
MSRQDKKNLYKEASSIDGIVRLFAFTNQAGGYKVVFSPHEPVIAVRAKHWRKGDAHPTVQWGNFADAAYARNAALPAVFLADASHLPQNLERDETFTNNALGPLMKRVSKTIIKLNPTRATIVGAGPTALMVLKLGLYPSVNFADIVSRIVLFCPPPPPARDIARQLQFGTPPDEGVEKTVLIVVSDQPATLEAWQNFEGLGRFFRIEAKPMTGAAPPFTQLAIAALPPSLRATTIAPMDRAAIVCIDHVLFIRSPYTKQLEQMVEPLDLDGEYDEEEEDEEYDEDGDVSASSDDGGAAQEDDAGSDAEGDDAEGDDATKASAGAATD